MASATPSRTLPKSKTHLSSVPVAPGAPAVSPAPPHETAPQQDPDLPDPAFTHPDYRTPRGCYDGIQTLVIVCCHAIFYPDVESPSFPLQSPFDEGNWHLAPFQRANPDTGKPGEHETFLAHISAGLDALSSGSIAESSLLAFSGGATKPSQTTLTEARSYYHASLALSLAQGQHAGGRSKALFDKGRIVLEENSTDSFQNLLFSILLFQRTTGTYPKHVRIITHAFKARRFLELHAEAIRWPAECITVQGIDPVMSRSDHEETVRGEERFGYAPWQSDPYGTGDVLSRKRIARGWRDSLSEELGKGLEEGIQELLGGSCLGDLPWTKSTLPSIVVEPIGHDATKT